MGIEFFFFIIMVVVIVFSVKYSPNKLRDISDYHSTVNDPYDLDDSKYNSSHGNSPLSLFFMLDPAVDLKMYDSFKIGISMGKKTVYIKSESVFKYSEKPAGAIRLNFKYLTLGEYLGCFHHPSASLASDNDRGEIYNVSSIKIKLVKGDSSCSFKLPIMFPLKMDQCSDNLMQVEFVDLVTLTYSMDEISPECLFSAQAQGVVGTAAGKTKKTAVSTAYSASKTSSPSAADSSDIRAAASSERKMSTSGARRSDSEAVSPSVFKSELSEKSSSGSLIKGSALSNASFRSAEGFGRPERKIVNSVSFGSLPDFDISEDESSKLHEIPSLGASAGDDSDILSGVSADSASSVSSFELSVGFSESELRSVSRGERLAARRGRESRLIDGSDETERGRTRYSERDSRDSYVSKSLTERHELISDSLMQPFESSENMAASVSETLISSAERGRSRGSEMVAVRERERRSERDVSGIGQERMRERSRSL